MELIKSLRGPKPDELSSSIHRGFLPREPSSYPNRVETGLKRWIVADMYYFQRRDTGQ